MWSAGEVKAAGQCPAGTVFVPPGTFTMGCDDREKCDLDESPAHRVTLTQGTCWDPRGFTERQMEELKRAQPGNARLQGIKTACDIDRPRGFIAWLKGLVGMQAAPRTETCDKPLGHVNFYEARAVCAARGRRLPTEAERERAARGVSGADEYGTSSGRLTDDRGRPLAQYGKWNFFDGRAVAGTFAPKVFGGAGGIYDFSGNM